MSGRLADTIDSLAVMVADARQQVTLGAVCGEDVIAVRRLLDSVDLLCTQMVVRFSGNGQVTGDGYRDVGGWLAAKTGVRRSEGVARCEQANLLAELVVFAEAVEAGVIGIGQVRTLSAAVTPGRLAIAKRDEQVLVDAAAKLGAGEFALLVRRWACLCDDELSDPATGSGRDTVHERRRLQVVQLLNGMWRIDGLLDPVAGETVATALAAAMPTPSAEDTRAVGQRRADTLTAICAASLANTDRPMVGNERPNVNIVFHAADSSAHTRGNWFLRVWQIQQVMCDATITAVAATLTGIPFDVGTPLTAIPVRNRKAVVIRDQGCRYPGCGHPPHRVTER